MRPIPLSYAAWKLRMLENQVRERREYLALAISAVLLGILGVIGLWRVSSRELIELLGKKDPGETLRILELTFFTIYVTYFFMALANVISRFFSPQRLAEREQLMGPIPPNTLFLTELLDAARLPVLMLVLGLWVPLTMVSHQQGWPGWFPAVLGVDLLALFIQPTLLVMALYIAAIRFIPAVLLNRQGLLFLFFFVIALAGGSALDTIRGAYNQNSALSGGFPSAWVASLLPLMQGGSGLEAGRQAILTQSGRVVGLTLCLLAVAWVLYRYAFLEQLERFGVRLSASEGQGVEPRLDRLIYALAAPRLGSPVAAIIIKDLRSSRRDSAQRIAFTALAAVIFALVVVDLLTGRRTANVFLLIFFAYALFLVSCQGLSTFSAEGGVLENLARFPLTAKQILWAKILSHFVLFAGVILLAMGLVAIAPSPIPAWFRVPVAGIGAPLLLPFGLFLSWITVTLGAIFPKPGEGGGRKEISIFAMGMFFQLTLLLLITIPLSLLVPIAFGLPYIGIPLLVLVGWLSVLKILQLLAERSVGRALGAEMRSG